MFLLLTIPLSAVFQALILSNEGATGRRYYLYALMWAPALAALLTARFRRIDIASLGWGWGEARWNILAYLIPPGYTALAYLLIWSSGLGSFAGPSQIAEMAETLGWTGSGPVLVILGFIFIKSSAGFLIAISTALGEEIGWRGFLAPRVAALTGFTRSVLVVGAIWTVWHLPLLFMGDYNNGTEWWVAISCFTLLVFSGSLILAWLRLRSGSLWPCAIFHASHNLFVQGVFTPLTGTRGDVTAYIVGEFGIAVPAFMALAALLFWQRRAAIRDEMEYEGGLGRPSVRHA